MNSAVSEQPGSRDAAPVPGDVPPPPLLREWLSVLLWMAASAVMLAWLFPPDNFWPLAFVALVPWTVAISRTQRAWLAHWLSFFVGTAFFLWSLRWLMPVTGLGYAALAGYLGIYWTIAGWAIRTARRHHISPLWSLPITWVACEYLRGTVMTGFPWLFVAHGLHTQLSLIQISDITGAYGVSFVALLVNGVIAEALLVGLKGPQRSPRKRQLWVGVGVAVVVMAGTLGYGAYRLGQVDFASATERHGPRVAVIQEDFPLRSTRPYGENPFVILARYLSLAAEAAAEKPDLIAFPETVWAAVQNQSFVQVEQAAVDSEYADTWWWGNQCHDAISAFARGDYPAVNLVLSRLESLLRDKELPRLPAEGGPPTTVIVGSVSLDTFPESTYPKVKRYNSALVYDPDGQQRAKRYDKRHLVPFGELVPFRYGRFHWLYRWLNSLSPFSEGGRVEYSLTPGDAYTDFVLATDAGPYRFGTPICYEDTTAYVVREFVWDGANRRVDFLVNISNDGWFRHSNELPQHMAICVFRAVENRISIARAVNTGISGFIDPDGRIYSRVTDAEGRAFRFGVGGIVGYDLEHVYLDDRASFYGRHGDWFAGVCVLLTAIIWLGAVFERWVMAIKHRIELLVKKGAK